jgi:hypothetical protein
MSSFAEISTNEETVGHFTGMEPFTAVQFQDFSASLQSESQKQQIHISLYILGHQWPDSNI